MFYGDDEREASRFEDEVRRAWTLIPVGDVQNRIDVILDHIGPDVRDELRCMEDAVKGDPEHLLVAILATFGDNRDPTELLHELLSLRQRDGESVRAYSNRSKRCYDLLVKRQRSLRQDPHDETILRDHFWRSVKDSVLSRVLQQELHQTPAMTFRDVRETAIRWGRDDHKSQQEVNLTTVTAPISHPPIPSQAQPPVAAATPAPLAGLQ